LSHTINAPDAKLGKPNQTLETGSASTAITFLSSSQFNAFSVPQKPR
jgi:hypothetical protein